MGVTGEGTGPVGEHDARRQVRRAGPWPSELARWSRRLARFASVKMASGIEVGPGDRDAPIDFLHLFVHRALESEPDRCVRQEP